VVVYEGTTAKGETNKYGGPSWEQLLEVKRQAQEEAQKDSNGH
jgi:hypothetical protein